jgi:hypothetical protein
MSGGGGLFVLPVSMPSEEKRRIVEHCKRCRDLPPLQKGEAERLVAEYLATRDVTVCPVAYVAETAAAD